MSSTARARVVLAGTAALGLILDQVTKAVVVAQLEGRAPINVIGTFVRFDVSRNSGAAFSFAPAATIVFTLLAVVIAGVIVRAGTRIRSLWWAVTLGLLFAGAVGNLCDRLIRAPGFGRGRVVDFIDVQHFATFNVADSCLTCGAILAVALTLFGVTLNDRKPSDASSS
jgi:signal peptidase II